MEEKGSGKMKRKTFCIMMGAVTAVIIALAGLNIAIDNEKTWDACHPMANAKVSWEQSFHSGGWSGDQ